MDVLKPVFLAQRGKNEYLQVVKPLKRGGNIPQYTIYAYDAAPIRTKKIAEHTALELIRPGEEWSVVEFRKLNGARRRVSTLKAEG